VCEESGQEITHTEVNLALTDALRSSLGYELKEMREKHSE
jgi:hypothetical protein|tara:strand:- start:42050 stop:42169 length:120 start_codon:yes stop_codon:yes gene_type:complete